MTVNEAGFLTIPDVTVNEASPYAVFRVSAASHYRFTLSLQDGGTDFTVGDAVATAGADYGNALEVYNGTTWIPYTPGSLVMVPEGGSVLLVRVPIINDAQYEGAHAFTLVATVPDHPAPVTARGIIGDFGTGAIFNDSGAEDRLALKDDDRAIQVDSPIVNEGSRYSLFTIHGTPSAALSLALQVQSGTGDAQIPSDQSNIEFWNGSSWITYNGSNAALPETGNLLVRVGITAEQDFAREGSETFGLRVTQFEQTSLGMATIRDDGTGVIYTFNGVNGAYSGTTTVGLDDDFDQDGITPTTEEALATLAASQGIGDAQIGDLNGDGKQDAQQNALATLAWTNKEYFEQGNDGTLTDSRAIISIGVVESATNSAISQTSQLLNIQVEHYVDIDASTKVVENGTIRTVTLVNGRQVTTPWDPIRFEIAGQDVDYDGIVDTTLTDVSSRPGTQVLVLIDVRAAGLTTADVNAYIKYVSAASLAAGSVVDLDGNAITQPGWYDFTRRDPNSDADGARFVVENGKIVGIELMFTDNAFGDNDMAVGRIFDPGVPVYVAPNPTPTPLPLPEPTPSPISELIPALTQPEIVFESKSDPLYVSPLPHTQPIFEFGLLGNMDSVRMEPSAYVLDEVHRVRSYDLLASPELLTAGLAADPILYVLPAVNVSQSEAEFQPVVDQIVCRTGAGQDTECKLAAEDGSTQDADKANALKTQDGSDVEGLSGKSQTDHPSDTETKPAKTNDQAARRINFTDQLRLAAHDRSMMQRARSLERTLRSGHL